MKRTKFLSLVLAIAMVFSLVPSIMVSADSDVIWSENFDGKTTANLKSQGYTIHDNDSRIVVENGIGVAKTSEGGSGFTFSNLSAKAEGLVRVKYDVKLFNNAFDVNKSLLTTDKGNLPLIFFGAYGSIAQDYSTSSWSATLNPVSGVGYGTHWYNVDLLLDFDNGKITVNLKNLDDGTMTIENLVWDYDTLKSVSTIKGFDTYGWTHGNVADTGYDNMSIAYVSSANTPDGPAKEQVIYSQDFNAVTSASSLGTLEGAGVDVKNGTVVWKEDKSAGGFWFNNLDAKVADAPAGKISVKFDVKTPDTGAGATKFSVKTNGSNVDLISYGVWNCLRVTQLSEELGNPGFQCDVWHTNDIVLDFVNNKVIYNVYEKESGKFVLENFARDVDLSAVTAIKGFDAFGWAGAAELDNLVISYAGEEGGTPDTPDEPGEFKALIYEQDFDGKILTDIASFDGVGCAIIDGAGAAPQTGAAGFILGGFNAPVADAPEGKIRVKFDFISPDTQAGATVVNLQKNGTANEIRTISYGVWNCLRVTEVGEEFNTGSGDPGFAGNVWHTNDIVFDFTNNKVIYTVKEKDSGRAVLDGFERSVDLSDVTSISGLKLYGWAGPAKIDNIVIEYVTNNETPDTPDEPGEVDPLIYEEIFDGKTTADLKAQGYYISDDDSRIVIEDGKAVAKTSQGGAGFNFGHLSADAKGKVRVKYDVKLYRNSFDVNMMRLKTDAGMLPLMFFGPYGSISQDYDTGSWTATLNPVSGAEYGSNWYTVDLVLDFDNGTITVNMKNLDDGSKLISDLVWDYDTLLTVNTINGLDAYGWTHGNVADTGYDNILIEYVTETTPDEPGEPEFESLIYSQNYDNVTSASSLGTLEGVGVTLNNGAVMWSADKSAGGFWFNNLDAKVADAPLGQIRFKFDVRTPDTGAGATKFSVKTNGSNIGLVSYGVWNCLRVTELGEELGSPGFQCDVWHTNDIVLDFVNNKIIYNVYEKDSGAYVLKNFARDVDLSAVTAIKGFDAFGWAGAAELDNLVIEYVTETTPDEPDEPISERVIYSNNYDDGNIASVGTLADAGITIQNGEVVWPADKSAGGFRLGNLNAEAKGQILVQFDVKSPDPGPAATKFAITTNASNVDLISYGVWGVLRVTQLGEGELGDQGFTADAWYRNSIVFDFATNELIYNVYNRDTGSYALKDYVRNVDLSSITKITGFEGYGWSGAVCFDNLSIEYYSADPVLSGDSVKIYSGDVEEKHTSVNPGADKIVIDFAGVMDEATLENAVSIKNLTDDTDVAFSAELISTKYIITIDGGLAASKNYRLTVTADAANIFGVALEGDYTLDFVTNAGYVKVSGLALTQNGAAVTSLGALTAGQAATVSFNYEKTSIDEKNIKLIYVYYNGDELVKSVVKTVTISQDDKNGTKEDTEVIENLSGITSVSVMLWENFTSIKPLCEDIKLQ